MTSPRRHRLLGGLLGNAIARSGIVIPTGPRPLNISAMGSIPNASKSLTTSQRSFVSEEGHHLGFVPRDNTIWLVFDNFRQISTGMFNAATGVRTYQKVSIQKADRSAEVAVTFKGGARPLALATTDYGIVSDPVVLPWTPSRSDKLLVRYDVDHATTGTCPGFASRLYTGSVNYQYAAANRIDQVDALAPITAPSGALTETTYSFGPSFIIAYPDDPTTAISVISVAGTSRETDGHDTSSPILGGGAPPMAAGTTYFSRFASSDPTDGGSMADVFAVARCSCTGSNLSGTYQHGVAGQKGLYAVARGYGNIGYIPDYINDFINNTSIPQMEVDIPTVVATARAGGIERFVAGLVQPHTNGAWTLTDGSDQTSISNTGLSGGRGDTMNQYRQALQTSGVVDVIVDYTSVRNLSNYFKWTAPGTTDDGLHGSPAANILMAPQLRAAVLTAAALGLV